MENLGQWNERGWIREEIENGRKKGINKMERGSRYMKWKGKGLRKET